jgi:hypothetical protein
MTKLEGMTNDQMMKGRASFGIRHSCFVISLILIAQTCCVALSQAQSMNVIGRWKIEITFGNGEQRSLRFDAQDSGKGTFLLLDPRSNVWEPAKPSEAKWTQGDQNAVTFSGAVEFPIGNVGRDAGTLVFKGKFQTNDSITGEVAFFPLDQDPNNPKARPSKNGTFTAIRAAGG